MQFKISCEQFARLATVSYQPGESLGLDWNNHPHPESPYLACVRLEHHNGHSYAIATCRLAAVIEYLGKTTEPDGFVHITNDPALVQQCINETAFGSDLSISYDVPSGFTMLMSTMGYMFPGNPNTGMAWPEGVDWMTWIAEPPTKSDTAFMFNGRWLARMANAAPSGNFVLPRHVQRNTPVVVRDRVDADWIGVFLVPKVDATPVAVLPYWCAKP